jgi:hypothetical protein
MFSYCESWPVNFLARRNVLILHFAKLFSIYYLLSVLFLFSLLSCCNSHFSVALYLLASLCHNLLLICPFSLLQWPLLLALIHFWATYFLSVLGLSICVSWFSNNGEMNWISKLPIFVCTGLFHSLMSRSSHIVLHKELAGFISLLCVTILENCRTVISARKQSLVDWALFRGELWSDMSAACW